MHQNTTSKKVVNWFSLFVFFCMLMYSAEADYSNVHDCHTKIVFVQVHKIVVILSLEGGWEGKGCN